MNRRLLLGLLLGGATFSSAKAELWFDPTQLPSFSGTVERYIPNPLGEIDRLLFKEGPQLLFPAHVGGELIKRFPTGTSLVAWGIRARSAPAITLLAWSAQPQQDPQLVDRPSWRNVQSFQGQKEEQIEGKIRLHLLSPQGEVVGVLLENFESIHFPASVGRDKSDQLKIGAHIVATGKGSERSEGRAVWASLLGPSLETLEALPESTPR